MNPFATRFFAVVLAVVMFGSLAAGARAASILVTTEYDLVVDDDLCSVREAVRASTWAAELQKLTSGKNSIEASKKVLEKAVADIAANPDNNTYPKLELLTAIQSMITQAALSTAAEPESDPTLVAPANPLCTSTTPNVCSKTVLSEYQIFIAAYSNPTDVELKQAIALQERVIAALDKDIDKVEATALLDGCDDGTFLDTILLKEDVTYYLRDSIELAQSLSFRSGPRAVITRCTNDTECAGPTPPAPHGLFKITNNARVEWRGFELSGGDVRVPACPSGVGRGGAVEIQSGQLTLQDMRFRNNTACSGGAIYVAGNSGLEIKGDVLFADNIAVGDGGAVAFAGTSLQAAAVVFGSARASGTGTEGNEAGGRGGALFVWPDTQSNIALSGASVIGNSAAVGSAIFIGGNANLDLKNVTLARNIAAYQATVAIDTFGVAPITINNVTLVENSVVADTGVGTAGILISGYAPVQIANSVIAGNNGIGTECDFGALPYDATNFRRNYYGSSALFDACPGAMWPSGPAEEQNFRLPLSTPGAEWGVVSDPALPLTTRFLLKSLNVEAGFYVPIYPNDVNDSNENRLVNRGAGAQDVARCAEKDQRGKERLSAVDSDCDIGAVEYQVGRRADDVIQILVDEQVCIDVIANDIGDAKYVAGTLQVFDVERAGARAIVVSRTPGSSLYADPVLDLDDVCPNAAEFVELDGSLRAEAILFTPPPGFRGETNVTYGMRWETDSAVPVGGEVSGLARIQTESRGGITSSSLGGIGAWFAIALGLLACRRGGVRQVLLALGLLLQVSLVSAAENIIFVNSGLDEPVLTTPGDGLCTLREALTTARNDQANLTGGDCRNGNEGPDVIEFAEFVDTPGNVRTVTLQGTVVAYGGLTIRCPQTPVSDPPPAVPAVDPVCTIQRLGGDAPPLFRLIDSQGSLTLVRMTFEGGRAPGSGANKDGGAIFSVGNLSIFDNIFKNNKAASGGAIFLGGGRSNLAISGSTFDGNASTNAGSLIGGGVISTSQSDSHSIYIQSSVFSNNRSVASAAVLNLKSSDAAYIANSVFSGNESEQGPGAIDVSGVNAAYLRNLTVVDNFSGSSIFAPYGGSLTPPAKYQFRAIEVGGRVVLLTSSIVAANFVLDTTPVTPVRTTIDANCGAGTINSYFNLYGDDADLSAPGNTCAGGQGDDFVAATAVYNRAAPSDADYLTPLLLPPVPPALEGEKSLHRPYYPLSMAGIITDAGYTETDPDTGDPIGTPSTNQTGVFSTVVQCANIDRRGVSRASGGRCDRGAYEYLALTAIDDVAGNRGRKDRLVIVDILKNDLFDGIDPLVLADDIKQDCTIRSVTPSVPATTPATETVTWEDTTGRVCAEVFGAELNTVSFLKVLKDPVSEATKFYRYVGGVVDMSQEVEGGFSTNSEYVVLFDNGGKIATKTHPLVDPDFPEDSPGVIKLSYEVRSVDQLAVSNRAEITITVDNVPPLVAADEVTVPVNGAPVVIDLLANDTDYDYKQGNPSLASAPAREGLVITDIGGCGAVRNEDNVTIYWQCLFGKVTLNAAAGTITWVPDNPGNPFRETFTYSVSDRDLKNKQSGTANVTINFYTPDVNGGALLGTKDLSSRLGLDFLGGAGQAFFAVLILLGLRRRKH